MLVFSYLKVRRSHSYQRKGENMKKHLTILLVASMYPYAAFALVASALETAGDITSDTAHAISPTVGDVTDIGLDASLGTAQEVLYPGSYVPRYGYRYSSYGFGPVASYESPLAEEEFDEEGLND